MIISVFYMHVDGTFAYYVWIFTIFSLYNLWKLIEHLLGWVQACVGMEEGQTKRSIIHRFL